MEKMKFFLVSFFVLLLICLNSSLKADIGIENVQLSNILKESLLPFLNGNIVTISIFILFGLLELSVIRRYSRVLFRMKFVDGKQLVTVSRKRFFLPFTYKTKCYENLTKVALKNSRLFYNILIAFCAFLVICHTLILFMMLCLPSLHHATVYACIFSCVLFFFLVLFVNRSYIIMNLDKKNEKLFFTLFSRKKMLNYEKQINDAIANSKDCEIKHAPVGFFIYLCPFIIFVFSIVFYPIWFSFKYSLDVSSLIGSVSLVVSLVGFVVICCFLSLLVNIVNKIMYGNTLDKKSF